jgi:hypothetical protein
LAIPIEIRRTLARIVSVGCALAVLAGVGGWLLERTRFGATDEDAVMRVEADLRDRFDASATTLGSLSAQLVEQRDLIRAATRDTDAARRLFEVLADVLPPGSAASTGVTVYDAAGVPVAWAGRAVDLPKSRLDGAAALFVAPDALGPRLVRIQPMLDPSRATAPRVGTLVVERLLANVQRIGEGTDNFVLAGKLVPVSLRTPITAAADPSPYSFVISSSGQPLVEGHVSSADLAQARLDWRYGRRAAVLSVLAVTLLFCAAPLIELRRRARGWRGVLAATTGLFAIVLGIRLLFSIAAGPLLREAGLSAPMTLLANAVLAAALVWLTLDVMERRRVARPRRPLIRSTALAAAWMVCAYAAAGAIDTAILWVYERFLHSLVSQTTLDLLHFSLHPLSATRAGVAFGLVMLHAAVIWGGALMLRLAAVAWRTPRSESLRAAAVVAWIGGIAIAAAVAQRVAGPVPYGPLLVALAATGLCAFLLGRPRGWMRRASQAARLGALYLALVVPSIAMYPSLQAFAAEATEQLISGTYGPQAINQREDLQRQLQRALGEIDAMGNLPALVAGRSESDSPTINQAFDVWSQTALKENRLTSAIELYSASGRLVSRFALNLPELNLTPHSATGCDSAADGSAKKWLVFEEVSPFGASERHVVRASRDICNGSQMVGGIVVRVMLDYRTLPFVAPQRPSFESATGRRMPAEGAPGRDVEFAIYGWSRAPIFSSGLGIWEIPDSVFERLLGS